MGRVLLLDPSVAGISGNMVLGCLLDLGAPPEPLHGLAATVAERTGEEVTLKTERVRRYGFAARWADWDVPAKAYEVPGPAFLSTLKEVLDAVELSREARDLALRAGGILVECEAAVHDTTPQEVHFHELGSPDTVLDLVGTALLLDALGLPGEGRVFGGPVAVGRGTLEARHGHLPVPPFVTLEILRQHGIPYHPGPADGELATPTGVALLAALAEGFEPRFTLRPEAVGYGAGGRELEGVPNVLRGVLGTVGSPGEEVVSVLETNLDDVTGEVLGHLAGLLEASDALDFHLLSTLTKKNRPGYVLQVLCPPGREEELADLILRETGSLGIRVDRRHSRFVLSRETRTLRVPDLGNAEIRFKVARTARGTVVRTKPEYDDLRAVAERLGIPLREAVQRAQTAAARLREE